MRDGLKFESEQGGDPVLQPLLRFLEVWNPTLHALELGSATGLTKGTIIPQKPPRDDNPERWRDAVYPIRRTPRCYSSLPNRPTPELVGKREVIRYLPVSVIRSQRATGTNHISEMLQTQPAKR